MKIEIKKLNVKSLLPNTGQIEGIPANPRFIKDKKFDFLLKSLIDDPEMLEVRELIVYPYEDKYIIIGGNMRYQALLKLKYKEVLCKIITDCDFEKLKRIALKDNSAYGNWDWDILLNDFDLDIPELEVCGIDIPADLMEFDEVDDPAKDEVIPDLPTESTIQVGDKFRLGEHYLTCGDPQVLRDKILPEENNSSDIVIDLNGGLGSILITCEKLKRVCHTIERDPCHCEVIIERWQNLTNKKAVKIIGD
jgi:hypothetical protein